MIRISRTRTKNMDLQFTRIGYYAITGNGDILILDIFTGEYEPFGIR